MHTCPQCGHEIYHHKEVVMFLEIRNQEHLMDAEGSSVSGVPEKYLQTENNRTAQEILESYRTKNIPNHDFSINVEIKIHYLNPPEDMKDEIDRCQYQRRMDMYARQVSLELHKRLKGRDT